MPKRAMSYLSDFTSLPPNSQAVLRTTHAIAANRAATDARSQVLLRRERPRSCAEQDPVELQPEINMRLGPSDREL